MSSPSQPPRAVPEGSSGAAFEEVEVYKRDLFGSIARGWVGEVGFRRAAIRRSWSEAAWWLRPIAALLARREARALRTLAGVEGVPRLLRFGHGSLDREFAAGRTLAEEPAPPPGYWREARLLLSELRAHGVTHNDSHKPENWLVTPTGRVVLIDYQLASRHHRKRGAWARTCGWEDLRHLLKHRRRLNPEGLTPVAHRVLSKKSPVARWWARWAKPVYHLVTRRCLGWRDREGRGPQAD